MNHKQALEAVIAAWDSPHYGDPQTRLDHLQEAIEAARASLPPPQDRIEITWAPPQPDLPDSAGSYVYRIFSDGRLRNSGTYRGTPDVSAVAHRAAKIAGEIGLADLPVIILSRYCHLAKSAVTF